LESKSLPVPSDESDAEPNDDSESDPLPLPLPFCARFAGFCFAAFACFGFAAASACAGSLSPAAESLLALGLAVAAAFFGF
jgi:hypothetical protein